MHRLTLAGALRSEEPAQDLIDLEPSTWRSRSDSRSPAEVPGAVWKAQQGQHRLQDSSTLQRGRARILWMCSPFVRGDGPVDGLQKILLFFFGAAETMHRVDWKRNHPCVCWRAPSFHTFSAIFWLLVVSSAPNQVLPTWKRQLFAYHLLHNIQAHLPTPWEGSWRSSSQVRHYDLQNWTHLGRGIATSNNSQA